MTAGASCSSPGAHGQEGGRGGEEECTSGNAEGTSIVATGLLMRMDGFTFAVPYGVMVRNGGPHLAYCVAVSTASSSALPGSVAPAEDTKVCIVAVWDRRGNLAEGRMEVIEESMTHDALMADGFLALRRRLPISSALV